MPIDEVKRKRGVPDDVKIVRRTRRAKINMNVRKGLMDLLLDWPIGEGKEKLLDLLSERDQALVHKRVKGGKKGAWRKSKTLRDVASRGEPQQKRSSLPPLPQSQLEDEPIMSAGLSSLSPSSWRCLKSLDIVGFNQGAERAFVQMLLLKLQSPGARNVSIGWVLSNAAYDLNLSPASIKRYIVKFTADRAPFVSEDGYMRLRESDEFPEVIDNED